jgi:glycosyltransferase involved in cell wall biosynthesis
MQEILAAQIESDAIGELHVLAPKVNEPTLKSLSSDKLQIHAYAQTRGSPMGLIRLMVATMGLLLRVRPDVVHVHATVAGLVTRICALFVPQRPKVVYCPHGWLFNQHGMSASMCWMVKSAERILAIVTHTIVCVSEHERNCATSIGIPLRKCRLIRSGIAELAPDRRDSSRALGPLKVLFVGRFDRDKGFDTFLGAMERLVGYAEGGAVGAHVLEQNEGLHVPANVTMHGWRDREELGDLYNEHDLLVVPSRAEAFGLTALEAMRAGLPVFCSNVGGLTELVVDGTTGRHFGMDQVDELVSLISSTSHATLQSYGREGYLRYLAYFTATAMNRAIVDHYLELTETEVVATIGRQSTSITAKLAW